MNSASEVPALAFALVVLPVSLPAQQGGSPGPYKVLRRAQVGGEGGWDYICAGPDGRLYIPRGAERAEPATDSTPATQAATARITVYDLRTLDLVGVIPNTGGHGVVVDPRSGHGFSSSPEVTMFDTKTLEVLKRIDVGSARPDGIVFDPYDERVYIFSHPTKNATVIDARTGDVVGTIALGGTPEEGVPDGHGTLYDVMQDERGSVAVVNVNTMKTVAHYPLGDAGRCNGLALDAEHHVLFAACASSGGRPLPRSPGWRSAWPRGWAGCSWRRGRSSSAPPPPQATERTGGRTTMGVEIDLGPEIADFRREMREWIAANAPPGLERVAAWGGAMMAGARRGAELQQALDHPLYRQWEERLADADLVCPQWPVEVGGRGWDGVRLAVFAEELRRHGVPAVRRGMGESLVGPAIITHGTPEQQAHFLPRIVSGEDVYCQGYSEPDHGSDLGAVETRGVVDGDELVISGQKVWTSGAQRANMIFVLCRTDPDAPKHRGLSYVLVPFRRDNGIEVRPLRQMSGAAEFCEDFLDGARAPLFNVIGGLNNGWAPAMTTLGFERGGNATIAHLGFEEELWDLVAAARRLGRADDPLVRQRLAWAFTHVELMRYAGLRLLAGLAAGRVPGPEASVSKLFWSEYHRTFGEIALELAGAASMVRPDGPGYATDDWQDVFLSSRAGTIYSGTSEIQRNIIGERALGLPKEPSAERRA